jgi:plasmid segregation protein ParM
LSPTYLALLRGALHYIGAARIDMLVVGLPVSTFLTRREHLTAALLGEHPVGDKVIHVHDVLVLAQPHGALGAWGLTEARYDDTRRRTTLVVDCGYRTFDWIVARGFRVMDALSGAVNRGMRDAVAAVAERLSLDLGMPVLALDRIDQALRAGTDAIIAGHAVPLTAHLGHAQKVAEEAVAALKASVESAMGEIDLILVVGGAAWFFAPYIERAFPRHRVERVANSMMANVRGFQLYGMELEASRKRSLRVAGTA